MSRFITSLIVVALSGLVQSAPWFTIAGVKPNLVLVLTLIFFVILGRDWIERLALALVAELSIQFMPLPDIYGLVFLSIVIVCGLVMDHLRLQPRFMLAASVVASTVVLNVVGPLQWLVMAEEAICNLILVMAIYVIIELFYGKKILAR